MLLPYLADFDFD